MTKEKLLNIIKEHPNLLKEKFFKKHFPDHYVQILNCSFETNMLFKQKVYHYLHNDFELKLGLCKLCGKRTKYKSFIVGYCDYCSISCTQKSTEVKEKLKKTNIERYGVEYPAQSDVVKTKMKDTCLEKYGVDNAFQSEEIKNKSKKTCLEHYGVEHSMQSEDVKEKAKQTCLAHYGVEHSMQSEEVKNKSKQTCLAHYGVEHSMQSEEIKEKAKQTCLENYGVENPMQSEDVKEKSKQTCLEKYGVENPFQSDEVKEKAKQTCLNQYGVAYPCQSEKVKKQVQKTCLVHYGVENPMQSEDVKEKAKQTCLENYGVDYSMQATEVKEKAKQTNIERYGVKNPIQSIEVKNKIKQTCLKKFGVPYACMRPEARVHSNNSKPNLEFAKLLDENNISYNREFRLGDYSYDFKIDNILIEINPTITHNSYINIYGGSPKLKDYHLNKSKTAFEHQFNCIHIWDWDDVDKIINMLKSKETLYARNLELKEVSEKECNVFLNAYHLQNTCKGQTIRYGLYKSEILVQLMTFGKPRYNKKYELELLRLCSHKDYKIVGGAEKIFKYIVNIYKPKSIISYCDNSKFSGDVYKRLGFKKQVSPPSKHWYNAKTKQNITDNLLRQRGFDQLFGTNYGKGTSNEELMLEYGFLPVYDCGQNAYKII